MNRSLKGICFTVAGGCCWGMSGVMGKYLFDAKDLTATWLVTVRLLGAGICLLPCHSGVKSGNCDSSSVFCTNLNYGVLCISGKKISKERRSACSGSCDRRNFFACNTWKYKKLSDHQCSIILGIVIRFCFCSL